MKKLFSLIFILSFAFAIIFNSNMNVDSAVKQHNNVKICDVSPGPWGHTLTIPPTE